jgi:hypothetical protein
MTPQELDAAMDRYAGLVFERDKLLSAFRTLRWWQLGKRAALRRQMATLYERHAAGELMDPKEG